MKIMILTGIVALFGLSCSRDKPSGASGAPAAPKPSAAVAPTAPSVAPAPKEALPSVVVQALPVVMSTEPRRSQLTLAQRRDGWGTFRLYALQGAFLASRGNELFRLEANELKAQPWSFAADHVVGELWSLGGRFPDSVSGTATVGTRQHSQRGDYYDLNLEEFYGPLSGLVTEKNELPGVAWRQGSRLLCDYQGFSAKLAPKDVVLPTIADGNSSECAKAFRVRAFAANLDGAVVAVGPRCDQVSQLGAERWAFGANEGKLQPLPSSEPFPAATELGVVLGSGSQAMVTATSLAHSSLWQETPSGWRELSMPRPLEPTSIALTADGGAWLVSRIPASKPERPKAYHFDGSQWQELALPSEQEVRQKLGDLASPDPLWLKPNNFAARGDRVYLAANIMSGSDHELGVAIVELAPSESEKTSSADAGVENSDCTPLVVLFAVSKTTAPDYQYPATKDAVLGTPFQTTAQFLEVNRAGHRTLVAQTASRKDAEALAALIRQRITGSRPSVVCEALPEVLRKIAIE